MSLVSIGRQFYQNLNRNVCYGNLFWKIWILNRHRQNKLWTIRLEKFIHRFVDQVQMIKNVERITLIRFSVLEFHNGFTVRGGSRTAATSKMQWFVTAVNGWKPLTIITKRSILDVAAVLDPPLTVTASPWRLRKQTRRF